MILVPISLGELYDKLSILYIKKNRITDDNKLINIESEYDLLLELTKNAPIDYYYWYDLLQINSQLWDLENKIREKEKLAEFDNVFIEIARAIHYTNDKRSQIKKEINTKYKSEIIEEKSY